MAIRVLKRNTSARRGMSVSDFNEITKTKPEKSLILKRKQNAGRNNQGKITVRHRGGGAKRALRILDFRQAGMSAATVIGIEYDPGRSANIALVKNENGKKAYILAGAGLKPGDIVQAAQEGEIKAHNRLPLSQIPLGSTIYNIELTPGKGGQLVRSAGSKAQLAAKEGDYATIKLPSGEMRLVRLVCFATIGNVGNESHSLIKIGSAGRKRHKGFRPTVRGKAMNPNDHRHGGGEGNTSIGLKRPVTPWGKPALGAKTRRRRATDKFIVRRRKGK
ncbi:MAG: 50S ribosomal protein L2 [bacterium]